jgi:hypothetical protein
MGKTALQPNEGLGALLGKVGIKRNFDKWNECVSAIALRDLTHKDELLWWVYFG